MFIGRSVMNAACIWNASYRVEAAAVGRLSANLSRQSGSVAPTKRKAESTAARRVSVLLLCQREESLIWYNT